MPGATLLESETMRTGANPTRRMPDATSETSSSTTTDVQTCPYCGLPIDPGQATATVNGKLMHFSCYQEQSGGAPVS